MGRPEPPYRRALATFDALAAAPLEAGFAGPRALARSVGLAPTSGYRAVAQAEAAGLLTRDADGVYQRGPDACRIGLSALGFGMFAAASQPVLLRLRRAVRMTAFLGVVQDLQLRVGPFSMGRGTEYLLPDPQVALSAAPSWSGDAPAAVGLAAPTETGRRQTALIACLAGGADGAAAVVGVLLPPASARRTDDLADHVMTARDRLRGTKTPRP